MADCNPEGLCAYETDVTENKLYSSFKYVNLITDCLCGITWYFYSKENQF